MHSSRRKQQQGFTLVAIAAILIVASLLGATVLLSKDRKDFWQPKLDTKAQLAEINDALIKFQRANHRLPCPAPTNQLPESAGYGIEGANCDIGIDISGIVRKRLDGSACTAGAPDVSCFRKGAVPVRTLGLSEKYSADRWANRLTYVASETLINVYSFSTATGNLRVNDTNGTAIMPDAAYIVLSSGADAPGAVGRSATQVSQTCIGSNGREGKDLDNCNDDGTFTSADLNVTQGVGFFDDQIQFNKVDTVAQSINKPCAPPSPASPFPWGAGCSAPYVNMVHGASATLSNTVSGYAGTADVTCNNGNFTINSQSCIVQAPCNAATESWSGTGSGCQAARATLQSGNSTTLTNSVGGRTGSVSVACNNGVITQSSANCTPNNCSLPWGGTLTHGGSISAYQSSSVGCGSSCVGETRSCSYGVLSGSYTNQNCSAAACSNCSLPWGGSLAHNSSVTAYAASSVGCGSSCAAETRNCNNGTLSGSYTAQSCSATPCAACNLPWGGTISHGSAVTAYAAYNVACNESCAAETRYCNNGSLSGSYGAASCSVGACQGCEYSDYNNGITSAFTPLGGNFLGCDGNYFYCRDGSSGVRFYWQNYYPQVSPYPKGNECLPPPPPSDPPPPCGCDCGNCSL